MKNIKKLCLMLSCIALICALVTGCASKEARSVISHINALGEISLNSSEELQNVNSEYASLSDEDKSDVSNYSKLEKANNAYVEAKKMNAPNVVREILDKANGETDDAKSLLKENADYMTNEQINQCLVEIGRWEFVKDAENELKQYLKNPYSFVKYSATCSVPELVELDGEKSGVYDDDGSIISGIYEYKVTFDYGATNSFGGMIRDITKITVHFQTGVRERQNELVLASYLL